MADTTLPTDSGERKGIPLARGCLYYFPAALAEVAKLSRAGNDKHNPGEPLHHARGKSMDHGDCIIRHQAEWDQVDEDGFYHAVKVAWRALAQLQELCEANGAPMAPRALLPGESAAERWPDEVVELTLEEMKVELDMEAFRRQPDEVEGSPVNPTEVTGEPPIDRECVNEKRGDDCVYPGCLCRRIVE